MSAGIQMSQGEIIVLMDSDQENNPADIPRLVAKLEEGYDLVSGWRQNRWKNQFWKRRIPSQLANWLIQKISRTSLHDFGCTLKAYRRQVFNQVKLFGENHRFIPALASWYGFRITEIPVAYQPRPYGVSKYNLSRTWRVLLDLVFLRFTTKFFNRPLHFFGGFGLISLAFGGVAAILAIYFKLSRIHHKDFVETPLPILTTLFFLAGVILVLMGILAELLIRIYYQQSHHHPISSKKK